MLYCFLHYVNWWWSFYRIKIRQLSVSVFNATLMWSLRPFSDVRKQEKLAIMILSKFPVMVIKWLGLCINFPHVYKSKPFLMFVNPFKYNRIKLKAIQVASNLCLIYSIYCSHKKRHWLMAIHLIFCISFQFFKITKIGNNFCSQTLAKHSYFA